MATQDRSKELARCPQVLAELTARARTSEKFLTNSQRPLEDFGERYTIREATAAWPTESYVHLNSDSVPMDPVKEAPKSAFLVKRSAAIYLMSAARTQSIFKVTDINIVRELMARCPILKINHKKPLDIWDWMERTSGLYVYKDGDRSTQLAMIRGILTTLVWKVKECVRAQSIANGALEPLLDLQHLQETGVDLAYDPSWSRGAKSYAKEKIDEEQANTFAQAAANTKGTDPYTLAAKCPACNETVPPGTLSEHWPNCTATNPPGYRVPCPGCKKEFNTTKHLAQHRALHCRDEIAECEACGNDKGCDCRARRENLCNELGKVIKAATDQGTQTIFDLNNTEGRMLSDKELVEVCNLPGTDKPLNVGWKSLERTTEALGLEEKKPPPAVIRYRCDECGDRFTTTQELKDHMTTHEEQCKLCGFVAENEAMLGNHYYTIHAPCQQCDFIGLTKDDLLQHYKECPEREEEEVYDDDEDSDEERTKKESAKGRPIPYTCLTCSEKFTTMDDLTIHWDTFPKHRKTKSFSCDRCKESFTDAIQLLNHAREAHRSVGDDPLWCPGCDKTVKETVYSKHLKRHSELWAWCKGQVPCPHCTTRSNTVAATLEHILDYHKLNMATTLTELKRHLTQRTIKEHGLDRAAIMAIKKLAGEESTVSCSFEGCTEEFCTEDDLTRHREDHQCSFCDYVGFSPRDLSDHQDKHGSTGAASTKSGSFSCEKCGMKLATLKELTEHKDNHKKYACSKCHVRFTSNYLADKHELTCTSSASNDVFEASKSSDPLMVVMNSLGQVVNTFRESGAMDSTMSELLKDQLKKAKFNHESRQTAQKNHQVQRTYTFLKPPTFTPSNTTTSYNSKDTAELQGKEFSGKGTPEENFTRLNELSTAIGRIVESRQITKDVATKLLMQHLKRPAMDLTATFREDFEQEHGDNSVPEYEDILIFLESTYVAIKPNHAREQLNALVKGESENISDFFLRAWRCSHFASFTTQEGERYKFRQDRVKEVLIRNLGQAKKKLVEDEELERKMRGERPMQPREIVQLIGRHQNQKEDPNKQRPDYTYMGDMTSAYVKRVENKTFPNRGRGRARGIRVVSRGRAGRSDDQTGGQRTTPRGIHTRGRAPRGRQIRVVQTEEPHNTPANKETRTEWIAEARKKVGEGCFKCGKTGHGSKQCLRYKILTKQLCRICKTGFHAEKACARKQPDQQWKPRDNKGFQGGTPQRGFQPRNKWPREDKFNQRENYKPRGFGRGGAPARRGGRSRGGTYRGNMEEYKRNLTWKARQIMTGGNKEPQAIKKEPSSDRGSRGRGGRGRGSRGVYDPFLSAGDRISRIEAQDPADAYIEALNQGY